MPTVLFADADGELREAYGWLLSTHGACVATASDGLECIAKLRELVPDLLILDLDLPWGGGDGVLAVMREDPRLCAICVVITSAGTPAYLLDGLVSPPVIRVLTKPFSLPELLECVTEAASHWSDPADRTCDTSSTPGVLVVDDEVCMRNLLKIHLQSKGFRVWTAANGEEALDFCCNDGKEIAVVLLDVQMPHLDGPQTLDSIRTLNPDLPVCFMTGDPGPYTTRDLLARGARHVFSKPFCLDEVAQLVKRLANEPARELQEC